jgi:hypothetical protein
VVAPGLWLDPTAIVAVVEFVENSVDRGGRDAKVVAFPGSDAVAYGGEHGEFTLEVCCGSVVHDSILPVRWRRDDIRAGAACAVVSRAGDMPSPQVNLPNDGTT